MLAKGAWVFVPIIPALGRQEEYWEFQRSFRIQSKTLFQKQTKPKISFLVLLDLYLKFFFLFKIWTFVCFTCVDWPGKSKEGLRSLGNGLKTIHVGAGITHYPASGKAVSILKY